MEINLILFLLFKGGACTLGGGFEFNTIPPRQKTGGAPLKGELKPHFHSFFGNPKIALFLGLF